MRLTVSEMAVVTLLCIAGCQSPGPVFPPVDPPVVWPEPPDRARIRYVGELTGERSLKAPPKAWAALRALVEGPTPTVDFSTPTAAAVSGDTVYVADAEPRAVFIMKLETREFGVIAQAAGEPFGLPRDIAVSDTRLAVADSRRSAVFLFDLAGRFVATLGDRTHAPVERASVPASEMALSRPSAVAWNDAAREWWVVDAGSHDIVVFDEAGGLVRRIGRRGGGMLEFNYPTGVGAPSRAATVRERARTQDGAREQDDAGRGRPGYIADGGRGRPGYIAETGRGRPGYIADGGRGRPGYIGVADSMNFRVQLVDATGDFVNLFGRKGDAAGDFALPRDVAFDSDGHVYVLDNQFENVQVFDRDGRLLMAFGEEGAGPGRFSLPSGITIDQRDRIWIADTYNRRVQVFEYLREEE
jgi:DNA-binding beta-propeller fold protein YncE